MSASSQYSNLMSYMLLNTSSFEDVVRANNSYPHSRENYTPPSFRRLLRISGLYPVDSKIIFSDGGISIDTSIDEKVFLGNWNEPEGVTALRETGYFSFLGGRASNLRDAFGIRPTVSDLSAITDGICVFILDTSTV